MRLTTSSGFITSVHGKIYSDKFVAVGKVRHSQRMNVALILIRIITEEIGVIVDAHCLGYKKTLPTPKPLGFVQQPNPTHASPFPEVREGEMSGFTLTTA